MAARGLAGALLAVLLAVPVAAEPLFVLTGARQLQAEEPAFEVRLLVHNGGDAALSFEFPARLVARIETATGSEAVSLTTADEGAERPIALAPGSFDERLYQGLLPLRAHGLVTLKLDETSGAGEVAIIFPVESAELHRVTVHSFGQSDEGGDHPDLIDRILENLKTYEPVYFIAGGDLSPVTAKFQLSAQYRVLLEPLEPSDPDGFWENVWHHAHDLYFSYTQTSVWELSSPSAPFRDSSFRPAVYYLEGDLLADRDLPWDRLGFQIGLEHESNGQGGDDSRSLNIAFVRPIFTFDVGSHYHFTVAPKIYAYLEKTDNSDIDDYRGYMDLLLKFGRVDGLELTATLRKGARKEYGSAQLDASFPIARITRYFGAFLHAQLFYGYGDTLLQYDENAGLQLRGGIMVVPYGTLFP